MLEIIFSLLLMAGKFPFWVFLISYFVYKELCGNDWQPTLRMRAHSFLLGNLAAITSLASKATIAGSLCVICSGGDTVRGWPFKWLGYEGIEAIAAPLALVGNITIWWCIAAICLWAASQFEKRTVQQHIRQFISPFTQCAIVFGPLLFLVLPL